MSRLVFSEKSKKKKKLEFRLLQILLSTLRVKTILTVLVSEQTPLYSVYLSRNYKNRCMQPNLYVRWASKRLFLFLYQRLSTSNEVLQHMFLSLCFLKKRWGYCEHLRPSIRLSICSSHCLLLEHRVEFKQTLVAT